MSDVPAKAQARRPLGFVAGGHTAARGARLTPAGGRTPLSGTRTDVGARPTRRRAAAEGVPRAAARRVWSVRRGGCQMWPTPAPASAFAPRLVNSATTAATTATPQATVKATPMPETKVSCATEVIFSAIIGGAPLGTGA